VKIAVRKTESIYPNNFHYNVLPIPIESEELAASFELMGNIILEVDDDNGKRIMQQAKDALAHEVEVAILTERTLRQSQPQKEDVPHGTI
jgi:hypothetical protein